MKRLIVGLVAILSMIALAPTALAGTKVCTSVYQDGELCWRHCDFYDDNGRFAGSITEEYHC